MLLLCYFESRCILFSSSFFYGGDGVAQVDFFSPDACQAIKDDDLVLFFSPCFCATVQSNNSSPWVKNLASLLMVCTSTELITKAFSTVNFTQILRIHKVCAKNLNLENV